MFVPSDLKAQTAPRKMKRLARAMDQHRSAATTWSVVAPFFRPGASNRWIDDSVADPRFKFNKVPLGRFPDDWHSRVNRATGALKWLDYWAQAGRAFPASGLITVFPQPALVTAAHKLLRRNNVPLIAWCFNLGQYPYGLKRIAARTALRGVDRFVVHSRAEIDLVSEFLDVPPERVEFVPLQRAPIPITAAEDQESPFVVAMGSANRDYATLLRAAQISGLPCKVVASPRSIEGLSIPPNVSVEHGLSPSECHAVTQRSRFSVVPLLDASIASGQVTVIEAMRMNKPVIATKSIGTVDYISDGLSGRLVSPHDPEELAAAMLQLWDDRELRAKYTREAADFAATSLSDEAASSALARIMVELENNR